MTHRASLPASILLLLAACANSDGTDDGDPMRVPGATDEAARIDAWVFDMGVELLPPPALEVDELAGGRDDGDYTCSTEKWSETRQYDRITSMVANSQSLYPGALVGADALVTGLLAPKILPRSPLRFSASLEGVLDGDISATVDKPSLSSFRDAMHDILGANVIGQTPANVSAEISQVYSSEQFGLEVGASVGWGYVLGGEVSASLKFDETNVRSRHVVKFTQAYYTVDVDPPETPSGLFAPEVTLEDVTREMEDEAPVYVSSVTYGRSVLFTITSELSTEEVSAALEFAYRGTVSVDGSTSMTHEEVLQSSDITAFVVGGSGDAAVKAIFGIEELRAFIENGGSYDRQSPGAPIAYKLAWVADDSPAGFALTSEYEVPKCDRVRQDVRVGLDRLHVMNDGGDGGDELEIYGDISVIDSGGDEHVLWSTDAGQAVAIGTGQVWPTEGEIGHAIVPALPEPGQTIGIRVRLWDNDGNGDDQLADHTTWRPFEDGWRGDLSIPIAEGDQHAAVAISLSPVQ
jgi:thiol-activated cytolysin